MAPPGLGDGAGWLALIGAAVIAFYAFLGFEDMVNVAEEIHDVQRNLPLAIIATLVLTTVIYAAVATVATLVLPPAELAASGAPLAAVYVAATGGSPALIGAISVIALLNGALVQIVMAARIFYGLARQDALPAAFGRVHPRRHTPVVATVVAAGAVLVLVLALLFPLADLARATALVTLAVFAVVNLSLVRIKRRHGPAPGAPDYPIWLPAAGAAISAGVLAIAPVERLAS